jgi:hypothetical protein
MRPGIPVLHDHLMNSADGYNPKQNSASANQYRNFWMLPLHRFSKIDARFFKKDEN